MTFQIPSMTPLLVAVAVAIVLAVALIAAEAGVFFVRNRAVRVARHESPVRYYGRLVLGH